MSLSEQIKSGFARITTEINNLKSGMGWFAKKVEYENGFLNLGANAQSRDLITVTFTDATRTVSIAPIGADYSVYSNGTKYTITSTLNFTISNTTGIHFVYFNESGVLSEVTAFTPDLILKYGLVCFVYWNATLQKGLAQYEAHGSAMNGSVHLNDHLAIGAEYESGIDIGLTVDGSGDADSHIQFTTTSGYCQDEDLRNPINAHNLTSNIKLIYRSGASGGWYWQDTSNMVVTTGTGRAAYNLYSGGSWSLGEIANDNYGIIYIYAYPSLDGNGIIGIVGTDSYNTKALARAASAQKPDLGVLPAPEYKLLYAVVFQTSNSYANSAKSRVVSQEDGSACVDWRKSNPLGTTNVGTIPDTAPTNHSTNPVSSGGVYTALQTKQNTLTFDTAPTNHSTNPVTSGGIYTALQSVGGGGIPANRGGVANVYFEGTSSTSAKAVVPCDWVTTDSVITLSPSILGTEDNDSDEHLYGEFELKVISVANGIGFEIQMESTTKFGFKGLFRINWSVIN